MSGSSSESGQLAISVRSFKLSRSSEFEIDIRNLAIAYGRRVAIVGANGSGKTSLIEGMLGLTPAASSDIELMGSTPGALESDHELKRKLGVQLQSGSYSRNMRVSEIIDLHLHLYQKQDEYIKEAFSLGKLANLQYVKLSRGEKQRVDLFVAMAHLPILVLLDEPNTGLDHHFTRKLYSAIDYLVSVVPDATVVMASHTGEDLDLAQELIWLENGKIIRQGGKSDIVTKELGDIRLETRCKNLDLAERVNQYFKSQSTTRLIELKDNHLLVYGSVEYRTAWQYALAEFDVDDISIRDTTGHDFLMYINGHYE